MSLIILQITLLKYWNLNGKSKFIKKKYLYYGVFNEFFKYYLSFYFERVQLPPDDTEIEPEIEEDDAELILEKVEDEVIAEFDDEDDDIVHVDDITKLYKEASVSWWNV